MYHNYVDKLYFKKVNSSTFLRPTVLFCLFSCFTGFLLHLLASHRRVASTSASHAGDLGFKHQLGDRQSCCHSIPQAFPEDTVILPLQTQGTTKKPSLLHY
jgi:hypothetical protein